MRCRCGGWFKFVRLVPLPWYAVVVHRCPHCRMFSSMAMEWWEAYRVSEDVKEYVHRMYRLMNYRLDAEKGD